jgi:hypothetical protein
MAKRQAIRDQAAVGQGPEDAVEHQPVVFPLTAAVAVLRRQAFQTRLLVIGELVSRGCHRTIPGLRFSLGCEELRLDSSDTT